LVLDHVLVIGGHDGEGEFAAAVKSVHANRLQGIPSDTRAEAKPIVDQAGRAVPWHWRQQVHVARKFCRKIVRTNSKPGIRCLNFKHIGP
jgi:hypothetical protein